MANEFDRPDTIEQAGYAAARRGAPADRAGWCDPKRPDERRGPADGAGAPGDGPVALFGADDGFVATFHGEEVTVIPFAAIGADGDDAVITRAELEFEAVKVRHAGRGKPLRLYAVDTRGALWSIDFRPYDECPTVQGIAETPRCQRIAGDDIDVPIRDVVVLRRKVLLQTEPRDGTYELLDLDTRSGRVTSLGTVALDPDIAALDPRRHDILLAREKGELRLVVIDDTRPDAAIQIGALGVDRVTAAAAVDGTHMVLARKGGLIDKVDLRTAVPPSTTGVADPLARVCLLLRRLLEACGCGCHGKPDPVDPSDPDRPDDGGHQDDEPCDERHSAKIGFTAYRIHRVASHLVAVDKTATHMAVLDTNLNVQFERTLDRGGALIAAGQPHTQNLLVYLPRRNQLEAWGVADYVSQLDGRLPDDFILRPTQPMTSITYWGSKYHRADPNPHLKICLFPVTEPGQAYNDADMTELIDQVDPKIFAKVDDYYDENSFGELAIDFDVFGHDIGGSRKPLVLPQAMANYWHPPFRAGGLTVVMPADWTNPISFDGNEALEIQANPRAGAVKTYDVPFAAMWSSANVGAFPFDVTFDGTESVELTVETQDGDTHVLTVNFPAANLSVNEGGDVAGFLTDLGTHVTDAIRAAEATIAGSPTLVQDVVFRRIPSSTSSQFGRILGTFRNEPVAPADVTQKGRISVTSAGAVPAALSDIGLSSSSPSGVMTSRVGANNYFRECLRATQVDAGEGPGGTTAYFSTTFSSTEDAVAEELTGNINLTQDTGGEEATIEVLSSSGLAGTGWNVASPDPGSTSNPNNSNALRDSIDLVNDTFTAALDHLEATTAWNRATVEAMFADYDVMMIAHVGAPHAGIPLADQWDADDPVDFGSARMYARTVVATDQTPPGGEDPVQMGTSTVIGQKFAHFSGADLNNSAGVMAHEVGHAIGLPDLYSANGYRDDVEYVDPWAMMAGGNWKFHHFCGWSKWKLGWIDDDPDPDVNRTIFVDMPAAAATETTDAWLVPVEFWDNTMRSDVRDEVGGTVPIGQLMKISLGSDGGVTAFLELRADGSLFSQLLAPEPAVIATNGLDPDSDRSWAVNGLYRRSVHLLNDGAELQNVGDTWDFAAAPEFPVKGTVAEVVDVRSIRGGAVPVYRVRVEREQAEFVDLHFQDHVPSYKSPDIWVDWTGDNADPNVPRTYPIGTPTDQGETVRFPNSGTEKHFVVARVHNAGNVHAESVDVRWFVCDPPGAGDDGRWVDRGTLTIGTVGAGANELTPFEWAVDAATNEHQCMRMEIIDWTIPAAVDPATGDTVALASDDVKLQNNNAQQNVFDFEALAGSPYPPIDFRMQVHNDRLRTEIAALVPDGLRYGSKLTITPREWAIPSGEARIFNCRLELDETIIVPGCDNDSGFLLTAWRRGGEADENWGSCFYHVRPRYRTGIELLDGSWFHGRVRVYGRLMALTDTPLDLAEDMPLWVRVRMLPDAAGSDPHWQTVQVLGDGSFTVDAVIEDSKTMAVQAWFDRTDRLGSS
ncbi:MAG: hypothetical protein HKN07_04200, partial [Acidimicrobiia bacterium]|nr:hypothetical protein [Acidimicrobiia bacterium]